MNKFVKVLSESCHGLHKHTGAPKCGVYLQIYHYDAKTGDMELVRAKGFPDVIAYIEDYNNTVFLSLSFEKCSKRMIKTFDKMMNQVHMTLWQQMESGEYPIISLFPTSWRNGSERCMLDFRTPAFWSYCTKIMPKTFRMIFDSADVSPYFYKELPWLEQAVRK